MNIFKVMPPHVSFAKQFKKYRSGPLYPPAQVTPLYSTCTYTAQQYINVHLRFLDPYHTDSRNVSAEGQAMTARAASDRHVLHNLQ